MKANAAAYIQSVRRIRTLISCLFTYKQPAFVLFSEQCRVALHFSINNDRFSIKIQCMLLLVSFYIGTTSEIRFET